MHNKLHHIQDTIGEWLVGYRKNKKTDPFQILP